MTFKPGISGNPGGKPKEFEGIQQLARRLTPAVISMLGKIVKDVKAPPAARVSAGGMLLDRAYGRPPSFSTTDVGDFKRAVDLSDDQLIEIARRAGLTLEPPVSRETPDAPAPAPSYNELPARH